MPARRWSRRGFACRRSTVTSRVIRRRSRRRSGSGPLKARATSTCCLRTTRESSTSFSNRAASRWDRFRSSTRISSTTSGAAGSRRSISGVRRWGTDRPPAEGGDRTREEEGQEDEEERAQVGCACDRSLPDREGGDAPNGQEGKEGEEEEVGVTRDIGGGWRPPTGHSFIRRVPGTFGSRCAWHPQRSGALGDLAGLHAARAHPDPLRRTRRDRSNRDEIREPPTLRHVVGVADSVADRGAFPADVATLGHGYAPLKLLGADGLYSIAART